jgi:threonine dehydrogenase-like Zn-dependent dehydrogenase
MKALVYNLTPGRWIFRKAASFVSRHASFGPLSALRLRECPIPPLPGPDWVRLRTLLGGVCGTDLALLYQRNHPATFLQRFASFPAILGHENVACIDEIGPQVTGWEPGRRVCVEPAIGCIGRGVHPPCAQCAAGRPSLCEHRGDDHLPPRALIGLNTRTGGSWAEYFVAHQSQLHAVPDAIPDDTAVLVDPVASAAHAVLRRPPAPGESVLVNGSGIIALAIAACLRAAGHPNRVTLVTRQAYQAGLAARFWSVDPLVLPRDARHSDRYDAVARRAGAYRVPGRFGNQGLIGGFDLTYDCTGTGRGLTDAIKWTRSRGALVSVGTSGITLLDTTPIWFDELSVYGANGRQIEADNGRALHTYDLVFDWLLSGRLDLSGIPVARFPLADYRALFRRLASRDRFPIVKAAFEPGAS